MDVLFTARHYDLTATVKEHITRKLEKVAGVAGRMPEARVILTAENYRHRAEVTFLANRHAFVASAEAGDMASAADQAIERLERQLRRFKERRLGRRRDTRGIAQAALAAADLPVPALDSDAPDPETLPDLTRHDLVNSRPLSMEEAMEALDREGGEYLVFSNTETSKLNVLYRRQDGSYGLIEPIS